MDFYKFWTTGKLKSEGEIMREAVSVSLSNDSLSSFNPQHNQAQLLLTDKVMYDAYSLSNGKYKQYYIATVCVCVCVRACVCVCGMCVCTYICACAWVVHVSMCAHV